MIRISIPWVVDVISALNGLDKIHSTMTMSAAWGYLYHAKSSLDALVGQSLYRDSLIACRSAANDLSGKLSELLENQQDTAIGDVNTWLLTSAKQQFQTVFLAELATLPCFFVTAKAPYDRGILLDAGQSLMPQDLELKVPEAIFDVREAAICLAFDRGTASAFHFFRALESVVRSYHKVICNGHAEPKQRNLGVYIRALRSGGADEKIVAALVQIKDLHRNPTVHPEVAIPMEEAISIGGLVRSVVAAMLAQLPVLPATTLTTLQG